MTKRLLFKEYISLFEQQIFKSTCGRRFNNKGIDVRGVQVMLEGSDFCDNCDVCGHALFSGLNKSDIKYFQYCSHKFH